MNVRRAVSSDVVELAAMLASAFTDDPWMRWTVDAEDHDQRLAQIYELTLREIAVPHGVVWTTDECDAVAVWVPTQPTATSLVVLEPLKAELRKLAGGRACAAATAQELVVARLPRDAIWYLAVTGVRSDRQRRALGSAVLGPMLERLTRDRLLAVLDTSTAANVAFYTRHGFEVADELDIPGGGQGIAIASIYQIIFSHAGRRTHEGRSQTEIADELHPIIETVLDELDRWLSLSQP